MKNNYDVKTGKMPIGLIMEKDLSELIKEGKTSIEVNVSTYTEGDENAKRSATTNNS